MGSSTYLPVLIPTRRRQPRQRAALWLAFCLSLVASVLLWPVTSQALQLLRDLPHWQGLEVLLAQSPIAAKWWMLLWVLAASLSAVLGQTRPLGLHSVRTGALYLGALVWWVHVPAQTSCLPLGDVAAACSSTVPMEVGVLIFSIGMALFAVVLWMLRWAGWVHFERTEDGVIDSHRYGV